MFLNYIFHFSKECVILLIKGENAERFFNLCTGCGIRLEDIKRLECDTFEVRTAASDFKRMRPYAYKTRMRVHIKKKYGIKNIVRRYKKRVFFAAGFFLFFVLFSASTQFIWSVDVYGTKNTEPVERAARLAGVRVGAYKRSLPDGNEMKSIILSDTDDITWAWVYLKGTKAVIEVREAIHAPRIIDKGVPCNITAAQDGIITDMTVKQGIAVKKKNDVVLKGDVIIGGMYENEDGTYRYEHALGEVYATTYHKAKRDVKLYKEKRSETGRKKRFAALKIFSKTIPLYINENIDFEAYKIKHERRELKWGREHFTGIELVCDTYTEEKTARIPITPEEAAQGIRDLLEEEIAGELLGGSVKEDSVLTYKISDNDVCEVCLTMQFTEKIGTETPIEELQEKRK